MSGANHRPDDGAHLLASKLRPPWARRGLVVRSGLLEHLAAHEAPLVVVVAPAGYGKTTLLSQWYQRLDGPVAWLSLDDGDNDAARLLESVAAALEGIAPEGGRTARTLGSAGSGLGAVGLARLLTLLNTLDGPVRLVVDHLEVLHEPQSLDVISLLSLHLPPGSCLAVASRREVPLPIGRQRAQGQVLEIGPGDLAMDLAEARELLAEQGVELPDDELALLRERTEGWAVGLYLACLAFEAERSAPPSALAFRGDDRVMADYLRTEVLARLPTELSTFLVRTAVLEQLCGPLCDAVLGTTGSQPVLDAVEASNLLLVPLDRRRRWYRYHHLFRELLLSELERTDADLVPELHRRAASWLEEHGYPELSLDHAQAGGDVERAVRLVSVLGQRAYGRGQVDTARRWLAWFDDRGLVQARPQLAALAALLDAMTGRPALAEERASAAELASSADCVADGSPEQALVALVGALMARRGVAAAIDDAHRARQLLSSGDPWQAPCSLFEGLALLAAGELDAADDVLKAASDAVEHPVFHPALTTALAARTAVAIERGDWPDAKALCDRALDIVEQGGFDDYISSLGVHAVAARTRAHAGELAAARHHVAQAQRLRPLVTHATPTMAVFLLHLAHASLELSDPAGARAVHRQVDDILRRRPGLGVLEKHAEHLHGVLDGIRQGNLGASSLTTAELRLLPLLCTHLTFPEIGDRLHLSRHTVKTQAMAIYRKLGVSSRSEAVERAAAVGLFGQHAPAPTHGAAVAR